MSEFLLGFLLGSITSRKEDKEIETSSYTPYYPPRKVLSIVENSIKKTEINGGWHISMSTKLDVIDHLGRPSFQMASGSYVTGEDPGEIKTVLSDNVVKYTNKRDEILVAVSV